MNLDDLLDPTVLADDIVNGYIRARQHPEHPLTILNYAEKCVYERAWTPLRQQCRGLVIDSTTGLVVARPWPKFFNYGEHTEGQLDLDEWDVEVADKADGSLGILITGYGEPFLATRGSFISDQAIHATELYRERYAGRWQPQPGATYLFEIVYPGNRIVLDYQGLDDLILLGVVAIESGRTLGPNDDSTWPGPRVKTFPAGSLREALTLPPRPNAEGVVVRYPMTGTLVKIKQDDYVQLHRIVTGLNARSVWAACAPDGPGLTALLADLPDELHEWCRDVSAELLSSAADLSWRAEQAFARLRDAITDEDDVPADDPDYRRLFAQRAAAAGSLRPLLFLLLDGKRIHSLIWKGLRPSADYAPRTYTEDTA